MASSDSSPSLPPIAPLSEHKENALPINSKIAELTESRTELLSRIQGLKQDLQGWRLKMDTQVKNYQTETTATFAAALSLTNMLSASTFVVAFIFRELSELKKSLNVEVDQLRSEFQELRTTLKQQQEDVTANLKNLDLQDVPGEAKDAEVLKVEINDEKTQDLPTETDDNESKN